MFFGIDVGAMRHTERPVTTHQHDSRGPEPQRLKQKHELESIKGQRRSGFCYCVSSRPHASVNIAKSDPNGCQPQVKVARRLDLQAFPICQARGRRSDRQLRIRRQRRRTPAGVSPVSAGAAGGWLTLVLEPIPSVTRTRAVTLAR